MILAICKLFAPNVIAKKETRSIRAFGDYLAIELKALSCIIHSYLHSYVNSLFLYGY